MPVEGDLAQRIALLRGVDVSLLLKRALPDIQIALHEGRLERAAGMIMIWEDAFGGGLQDLNDVIDQVRGQSGYIRALAAFSRDQQLRAMGMDQFARGVFINSRRTLERWQWVPWLYRLRVEEFALRRLQQIKNSEKLFVVSGRAKKATTRPRVLREVLGSYKMARDQLDYVPALYAHALGRMSDVLDADEAIERDRVVQIAMRDTLRQKLQISGMHEETLKRISRLPSIASQIEAYRAVDAQHASDILKQRGKADALRTDATLSELATGAVAVTRANLLATLASQLTPRPSGSPT